MEIDAVIMAGGSGTRLWPVSRQSKPKQYIDLGQGKCMLQQTIERLYTFISPERCHIITNQAHQGVLTDVIDTMPLPPPEIIYEPQGKNTAACIAYSALLLKKRFGNCLACFIPADSLINDDDAYRTTLEAAFKEAESGMAADNGIIIIGITPSCPATGYGYIKPVTGPAGTETIQVMAGPHIRQVECFLEKPGPEQARELYSSGEYLWNSGMVIGQTDAILEKIRKYLPVHYSMLYDAVFNDSALTAAYEGITSISFDNGVLENNDAVYVFRGCFGWDDIGSIDALDKINGKDADGNTVVGCYLGMDTKASVIYSEDKLVAALGINDMILVNTQDVLLVCPRERVQDIKQLVALLQNKGYGDFT